MGFNSGFKGLTLQHTLTIRSRFSIQLIISNFSPILIVFRPLFTPVALSDADLRFSLMLVTKASAVGEETMGTM